MMQSNLPAGTGRITRLFLPAYPKASYTLLDMSRERLDIAKAHIEDIWEEVVISQTHFPEDEHYGYSGISISTHQSSTHHHHCTKDIYLAAS